MRKPLTNMYKFLKIITVSLLVYLGIKSCFYLYNFEFFSLPLAKMNCRAIVRMVLYSIRMDFAAVCLVMIPVVVLALVLSLLPMSRSIDKLLFAAFLLTAIPFFLINIADIAYYSFHQRRLDFDAIYSFKGALQDSLSWFVRYWQLSLFALLLCYSYVKIVRYILFTETNKTLFTKTCNTLFKKVSKDLVIKKAGKGGAFIKFLLLLLVLCWGIRGFGSRPIMPSTPLLYFEPVLQPLVSNSTISFLYSAVKRDKLLPTKTIVTQSIAAALFPVYQTMWHPDSFLKKNIVLFVMEGISKSYLDSASTHYAKMPFFDSLQSKSIVYTHAFANGLQSNEGLPSILLSIPPLLDIPYFHSTYASNAIRPIGKILKEQGYNNFFFLGAERDHFGFEKLAKLAGVEHYISSEDYGNGAHHDGHWGIADHYFLPFVADKLKQQVDPFFAIVYNVSTHPPFAVPGNIGFSSTHPQGSPQRAAAYYDYALKLFFDTAKTASWYNNTVFAFISDHNIQSILEKKADPLNSFSIPFMIHESRFTEKEERGQVVQQLDFVPGMLDYLQFSGNYSAFGTSFLKTEAGVVFQKYQGNMQVLNQKYIIGYNQVLDSMLYALKYESGKIVAGDLLSGSDLDSSAGADALGVRQIGDSLLIFLQQYNYQLKHNLMSTK